MLIHQSLPKVTAAVMAAAVCLCLLAVGFSNSLTTATNAAGLTQEYETELFGTGGPIQINIKMDSSDWEEMLENAIDETYYPCDVEINGTTFYRVGIRPKGNTSLSAIAMDPTTDRYSLKLEFDRYVDGQTCFGLDKLVLNNNYADATNMKEALVYDMYRYLGADASLYQYARLSVNGEYWGVYLALEAVEESFLLRNYGVADGCLYKPEPAEIGGGMDGFGQNGGSDLNYADDDLESYSSIWEGAVTDITKSDRERVVTALKHIFSGTDPEACMDVDNLLRYMAVHVFAVNQDSLSGSMAHNYYLYEEDGRLNLLPWDYNLSFGGFTVFGLDGSNGGSNNSPNSSNGDSEAGNIINDAIDTPFEGTHFFDTLLANEEYLTRYHAYLSQLVCEYANGGGFASFYERTRSQIDELVETDPTAFYSYDEYTAAAEMLYDTILLRARSIAEQLDGSIPSTDSGQRANPSSLIDASALDLSVMGSMNTGAMDRNSMAMPSTEPGVNPSETFPTDSGIPAMNPSDQNGGPLTDQTFPDDEAPNAGQSFPGGEVPDTSRTFPDGNAPDASQSFPGDKAPGMNYGEADGTDCSTATKNLITDGVCLAILLAALIFATRYRRRSRRR